MWRIFVISFYFFLQLIVAIYMSLQSITSLASTVVTAIPLSFLIFHVAQKDKTSFLVVLYWYIIQIIGMDFDNAVLNYSFGISFDVQLSEGRIGIDVLSLICVILLLFELETFFPDLFVER